MFSVKTLWHTGKPLGLKLMLNEKQIAISENGDGYESCFVTVSCSPRTKLKIYVRNLNGSGGVSQIQYIGYQLF